MTAYKQKTPLCRDSGHIVRPCFLTQLCSVNPSKFSCCPCEETLGFGKVPDFSSQSSRVKKEHKYGYKLLLLV